MTIYDCMDRVLLSRIKNEQKQYSIDFFDSLEKKEELIKWLRIFGLADDFRLIEIPNHPELFVLEFKEKGKDYYICGFMFWFIPSPSCLICLFKN